MLSSTVGEGVEGIDLFPLFLTSNQNESGCIHTAEYTSAVERSERLVRATTWMNLEIVMLCERNPAKKEVLVCDSIYKALEKQAHF